MNNGYKSLTSEKNGNEIGFYDFESFALENGNFSSLSNAVTNNVIIQYFQYDPFKDDNVKTISAYIKNHEGLDELFLLNTFSSNELTIEKALIDYHKSFAREQDRNGQPVGAEMQNSDMDEVYNINIPIVRNGSNVVTNFILSSSMDQLLNLEKKLIEDDAKLNFSPRKIDLSKLSIEDQRIYLGHDDFAS